MLQYLLKLGAHVRPLIALKSPFVVLTALDGPEELIEDVLKAGADIQSHGLGYFDSILTPPKSPFIRITKLWWNSSSRMVLMLTKWHIVLAHVEVPVGPLRSKVYAGGTQRRQQNVSHAWRLSNTSLILEQMLTRFPLVRIPCFLVLQPHFSSEVCLPFSFSSSGWRFTRKDKESRKSLEIQEQRQEPETGKEEDKASVCNLWE